MQNGKIEPYSAAMRGEAARALRDAFMNDPLFRFIVPDDGERARWLPILAGQLVSVRGAAEESRVWIDPAGKIGGVCTAGAYPPTWIEDLVLNVNVSLRPRPWEPKLGPLMRISEFSKLWKLMHWKGPHWYVYILGVTPEHQRKGVGRMLMRDLIARAEARGIPLYLETQTESNVPFYRSLGFEVTEHHRPFAEGPGTWGMFRRQG